MGDANNTWNIIPLFAARSKVTPPGFSWQAGSSLPLISTWSCTSLFSPKSRPTFSDSRAKTHKENKQAVSPWVSWKGVTSQLPWRYTRLKEEGKEGVKLNRQKTWSHSLWDCICVLQSCFQNQKSWPWRKTRNFPTKEVLIWERAWPCELRVAELISSNVQSPQMLSQNVQTWGSVTACAKIIILQRSHRALFRVACPISPILTKTIKIFITVQAHSYSCRSEIQSQNSVWFSHLS